MRHVTGLLDVLRRGCYLGGELPPVEEVEAALAAVERLIEAADELRLWAPGRKGYAAAQNRLFAALAPFKEEM